MRFKLISIVGGVVIVSLIPFSLVWAQTSADTVLARVGTEKIYLSQFQQRLQSKGISSNSQSLILPAKQAALDDMIDELLIEKRASNYNFKSEPELQSRIGQYRNQLVLGLLRKKLVSDAVTVSDSEIVAYYQANREAGYKIPEAVKFRQIFISFESSDLKDKTKDSKKFDREARAKSKEILRRLKNGADFGQLAKTFSNHKSAKEGGEMGFVPRGELPPELEEVLYSSSPGLIERPIKSSYGYHIVEIQDFQTESYQDLTGFLQDGIRDTLKKRKEEHRQQVLLDSLKQQFSVKYRQGAVTKLTSPPSFESWLLASGPDTLYYTQLLPGFQSYLMNKKSKADSVSARDFLAGQADTLILLAAARQMKLGQDPAIKGQVEKFKTDLAKQKIRAQKPLTEFNPTPKDIADYYGKHKETWKEERPIYVQHIVLADSARAAKVRKEIIDGLDFRHAALKYYPGEKEIREIAYDLGFISAMEMPASFYKQALELQVGQISQPVRTEYGWHLIKLVARKDYQSLEEVQEEIRAVLLEDKNENTLSKWRDQLRKGTKIWVNQKLLERVTGATGG
jgi:parvulin-like peptidyl-prolyl isomerase